MWACICLLTSIIGTACNIKNNLPTTTPATSAFVSPTSDSLVVLFAADDDLWRTDVSGSNLEQLTDGRILNWNIENGNDWLLAARWRPPQISPDGRWIALSSTGREVILVDVTTQKQSQIPGPGAPIVTWSPDSRYFAYSPDSSLAGTSDDLYLYDIQKQQSRRLLQLEKDVGVGIVSIVWSPDGRFLAFGCCFTADTSTGLFTGKIQQVEIATGNMEVVGEMWSSVGGGSPELCWTANGPLPGEAIEEKDKIDGNPCSVKNRYESDATSPDGNLLASLSPTSPDDTLWTGSSLLTVKEISTDSLVWQREVEPGTKRVFWSPDSQYLLLDDDRNHSPIWRIKADGSSELEIIVKDGYLLEIIPQWQSN